MRHLGAHNADLERVLLSVQDVLLALQVTVEADDASTTAGEHLNAITYVRDRLAPYANESEELGALVQDLKDLYLAVAEDLHVCRAIAAQILDTELFATSN